jgi:hypothetical protein
MRILSLLLSGFLLFVVTVVFTACGGGSDDPKPIDKTEKEKNTELLVASGGSWTAASSGITVGGVDVTADLFKDFSIKFTDTQFTTTGTTPVFLRTDTWHFKDETAKVIIRGQDNKEMTIESISATQLKLSLQWDETTYEGGRKKSIPGTYVFTLTK